MINHNELGKISIIFPPVAFYGYRKQWAEVYWDNFIEYSVIFLDVFSKTSANVGSGIVIMSLLKKDFAAASLYAPRSPWNETFVIYLFSQMHEIIFAKI